MKKIFCGGSRKLGRLNPTTRKILDSITSKGFSVLVGDANGSDRAIQEYLAEQNYSHVEVFYAGNECRNNVAHWTSHAVVIDRPQKDFQYYAARDLKMCEGADYGFMLWDGKSKGTLNNILNLFENNKNTTVYFSPKKIVLNVNSTETLNKLLQLCDKSLLTDIQKKLNFNKRVYSNQMEISFIDRQKEKDNRSKEVG
jgi:hypothetical protein